ncbi:MAG: 30S ribosome-binding factor RbfA [Chlorobi bacterium]|nr:30S ribosome-binding factor RbfA [Chlorobiota bacterium]
MESTRQKKIGKLLQRDLSEMFMREAREYTLGAMVSVTVVRVTSDLSIARVYLSIFPPDKKDEVFNYITENTSKLRYFLGQRVGKQLRVIPELQFFIDDSLDYIDNIDRLLKND